MTDLHRLSIRELSEGLAGAKFSSRELTEHYLKRIAKLDTQVKSYVTVTAEQALAQADAADALAAAICHAHASGSMSKMAVLNALGGMARGRSRYSRRR